MCGVIGLLAKDPDIESRLGSMLVTMIAALGDRGPDSSGVALYSSVSPNRDQSTPPVPFRVSLGSDVEVDWEGAIALIEAEHPVGLRAGRFGPGVLVECDESVAEEFIARLPIDLPKVRVVGKGRALSVIKDTGRPEATCERYGVASWQGYMAVAHTRMATESAVTVLHSHPFVPAADLCVVHNGSFSNHNAVRRSLIVDGARFDSDNDSEVAARLIARRLEIGDDLEEATRWVMKEMDGFFTLVISTATGMSVVRDAFACKPAVVAETDQYVAVASEYRALAELPGIGDAEVFEPRPEEVYTWIR